MKRWQKWSAGALAVAVVAGGVVYAEWNKAVPLVAMGINWVRYLNAPAGTLHTEQNSAYTPVAAAAAQALDGARLARGTQSAAPDTEADWPSYNKTLSGNRYAALAQIHTGNVAGMAQQCVYDTGVHTGFNSGLVEVQGKLLFATEFDTFAIDANDCHLLWRSHEDYTPASAQGVNRGVAVLDGRVYRGTQDGRVLAYDLNDGHRLWEARIADGRKGESVPAAPIAWQGLVFAGNAGGDVKGVKGRMYALDAATGQIRWEFYLVPRSPGDMQRGPQADGPELAAARNTWGNQPGTPITGGATWTSYTLDPQTGLLYVPGGNPAPDFAVKARPGENLYSGSVVVLDARTGHYQQHYKIVPKDWHDWDVSSAPALIETAGGKRLLIDTPKDGHLYAFDRDSGRLLYKPAVTKVENADAPFEPGKTVHFCPGSVGGSEWNGPAFDPQHNQILAGQVQWCASVKVQPLAKVEDTQPGAPWSGEDSLNPFNTWGKMDPVFDWAGWVTSVDADSGQWRWRVKSNYPVQSGVTPTGGGLVFFGDMGGYFYALDARNGQKLWGRKLGGAVGGGVITYDAGQGQKVAAATGLTEVLWPTEITTAKVRVLGLPPVHAASHQPLHGG